MGAVVYSETHNNSSDIRINTYKFKTGYYFAKLITKSGETTTKKFIKK